MIKGTSQNIVCDRCSTLLNGLPHTIRQAKAGHNLHYCIGHDPEILKDDIIDKDKASVFLLKEIYMITTGNTLVESSFLDTTSWHRWLFQNNLLTNQVPPQ